MATETDQQDWQEIQHVLTNVGVYLSTTLKKEHLKKVADKQRLNLMTEVHSALTMISKKHDVGLSPFVKSQSFTERHRGSQRRHQSIKKDGPTIEILLNGEDSEEVKTDNEDTYDEVTIKIEHVGEDTPPLGMLKNQETPLPQLPVEDNASLETVCWRYDYTNIYRALWDCKSEAADELELKRGDFVHIISREYEGWWIGEKENLTVGLVPSQYLMEAFVPS
ncbi:src kinase-associated phosphoprotein 2-like isoform X2 [Apostichopus japonicus]